MNNNTPPPHITYLFGAGASYHAMPIYSEVLAELFYFGNGLIRLGKFNDPGFFAVHRLSLKLDANAHIALGERFIALYTQAKYYFSIDTYAKVLYHRRDPNLFELKHLVDLYFSLRTLRPNMIEVLTNFAYEKALAEDEGMTFINSSQERLYKREVLGSRPKFSRKFRSRDDRYTLLLAALAREFKSEDGITLSFPENFSVVSWNYDAELEIALNPLTGTRKDVSIGSRAALSVHLNGFVSCVAKPEADFDAWFDKFYGSQDFNIKYAWDYQLDDDAHWNGITPREIIDRTTHLVVVGYSFPAFNREVDRQILGAPHLEKVYIQDLPTALPGITDRIKALLGERGAGRRIKDLRIGVTKEYPDGIPVSAYEEPQVQIVEIDSVEQFHIPFELL